MTSQGDGKALVRRIIEELWTSDAGLKELAGLVAPGYVHHAPMADVGFDGFVMGLSGLRTAFPDLRYNVTHVIEDGDLFAVHMRCTGTNTGPFGPIAATGKVMNATGAYHCRIVDGRLVEDWDAWTALGLPRQMATLLQS